MATLLGTKLNNKLLGTSGNDLLAGLGGNDTLDGGLGTDSAWYSGLLKDYLIGTDGSFLTLSDRNLLDGDDGRDLVTNIEQLSFSNAGLTVTNGEFRVNTTTYSAQYQSAVTALADGGFVVTWTSVGQENADGSYGVYAQRYDAQGNAAGAEFRINTYTTSHQFESAVTALADGGFVITWSSNGQDLGSYGVYAQRYDALGVAAGGEFQVNTYTTGSQLQPTITALADGGFVVTWQSDGQDGSAYGVYAQRYDALGNAAGGEFRVNTYTTNWQYQSAVTGLADGGFLVTWNSNGQDGDGYGVYAQRYDAQGNTAGGEFRVNTYTTSNQSESAVTGLADGGFVVTWDSAAQDGDGYGVYAQRFDAQGNAVGLKVTGTAAGEVLNLGLGSYLTVDGAGGNDTITGGASDDNLFGGLGNDRLTGNDGDDRLDGGAGNDALLGGNGGDTYVVDSTLDVITETGLSGSDTVEASFSFTLGATLENLTLTGSGNINATGNAYGNLLLGNAGNNLLDGKAGGDLMMGGAGNDTYRVDSPFDLVGESPDQGTDKVISSTSYALGENLENLELSGTANLTGTGNALANILTGNAGANSLDGQGAADTLNGLAGNDTLTGGDGDDWLIGGLGNDTITGGASDDNLIGGPGNDFLSGGSGADIFKFDTAPLASNVDHLSDFTTASDKIYLSQTLFANASHGVGGVLDGADFAWGDIVSNTAAAHIVYETDTGNLYYNADGAGAGALALVAVLDGHPALASGDIFLT